MTHTIELTLLDQSVKTMPQGATGYECAASISEGLANSAVAVSLNGRLRDMSYPIEESGDFRVIKPEEAEGLEVIRHSAAHLLAQAVQLLYPKVQVTIGPVIEDGFYYDFYHPPGFSDQDLLAIEKTMQDLVSKKYEVRRQVVSRAEAVSLFTEMGESYKVEIIKSLPESEEITLYRQGDFVDLCRGPHVRHTGQLKAFKLTKVSGAYWRGDHREVMLQRIYGTAWDTPKALKAYLHRIEEAKKRDHRLIGARLGWFHFQDEAPGMPFFHPKGWSVYTLIMADLRKRLLRYGYQEVNTPQILPRSLWEQSGHWDKFGAGIFTLEDNEKCQSAVKPMSCPGHIQIFNQRIHSYRDLPLRLSEFGHCHRNEPSGTLHGLMRVRSFVQDDGHIFCTKEQIGAEVSAFIEQTLETYKDYGFEEVSMCLSTRPEQRVGDDAVWDVAEKALMQVLDESGLAWTLQEGEGAFYGPKIEFSLKDCLGRIWQCGTVQLDFSMPERLGASYIDDHSQKQVPVMLHRATIGSIERFLAILIENTEGRLPFRFVPVQVMVAGITSDQDAYVKKVSQIIAKEGFRVETDLRNEKIGYKIREHAIARIPYVLVCGAKEEAEGQVAVRTQLGENLGSESLDTFLDRLKTQAKEKSH